jgi:hypothetical protein
MAALLPNCSATTLSPHYQPPTTPNGDHCSTTTTEIPNRRSFNFSSLLLG